MAVTRPEHRHPLDPASYQAEVYQKGLQYQNPPFTFDTTKWESLAKVQLSATSFSYVAGNAGQSETYRRNLAAFRKWSIISSRLTGTPLPSLKTKVLGHEVDFPIALAPIGVQAIFHPEAEAAAAKAGVAEGVPFILSSATSTPMEKVAEWSGDGQRYFQLYWPGNESNDITASLLKRARASGYTALFVTLDTYLLGWRPSDLDLGYNPFLRSDYIGVANGLSDPVFRKIFKEKTGKEVDDDLGAAAAEWSHREFPVKNHSWEDLEFIKSHWDGPIVLKGIQTVADARRAVEAGVQGIVVSNHGGRQQDGGAASLDLLPPIADAVGDKLDVLYDSGIRCGADILKALALGAKMVLLGRPYIYGLALGGEEGVRHIIRCMLGDLEITMHQAGVASAQQLVGNRDFLLYNPEYAMLS